MTTEVPSEPSAKLHDAVKVAADGKDSVTPAGAVTVIEPVTGVPRVLPEASTAETEV